MRGAMPKTPPSLAFAVAAVGIASYAAMDAVMKDMSIVHGAYSAVLWRSVAGIVLLGPVFVARRGVWPRRAALALHIARGAVAGASLVLFFWGLARVPMAQTVALTFLAPLIAVLLAAATLGERIRRAAIGGSAVAGIGVLVIAAGQIQTQASGAALLGSAAIFGASILYAGSLILLRKQAQVTDPLEIALFTNIVVGALLLVGAPWYSAWPAAGYLPHIVGAAALGSVSGVALAWAYGRAEAQVLAPVEYTAFLWAALLGWCVFGEQVSRHTALGAVLIIAGCVLAVRGPAAPAPQTEAAA